MSELAASSLDGVYTVFAQRTDARVELALWRRHAEEFLGTRVGLTTDKSYDAVAPATDEASVVVAPLSEGHPVLGAPGVRRCWSRPRTEDDLRATEQCEQRSGRTGLADLAKRCPQVWLVEAQIPEGGDEDLVALRIATIIAGVVLGPILAPHAVALFGPKTARARLEA